jgi:exonuclease III
MDSEPNLNIVVWNVRGLNDPARRTAVRVAVGEAAASVVCVSESKLHTVTQFDVVECFGPRYDGFAYLPAVGSAGGLILAWNSDDVQVIASRTDRFSVSVQLSRSGGDGMAWWLTTVYGPTTDDLKVAFLDELRALRAALIGPWAIAGDFNMIMDARDKSNSRLNRRSMEQWRSQNFALGWGDYFFPQYHIYNRTM